MGCLERGIDFDKPTWSLTASSFRRAPQLESVDICNHEGDMGPLLDSLCLASQLKCLKIDCCPLPEDQNKAERHFRNLAGMLSLTEVQFSDLMGSDLSATNVYGVAFWRALASLKHLEKLVLLFDTERDQPSMHFFDHLSFLKNLRQLETNPQPALLYANFKLNESFCSLTRLTRLDLPSCLPSKALRDVIRLPALQHLRVCISRGSPYHRMTSLPVQSKSLTRLEVLGFDAQGVDLKFASGSLVKRVDDLLPVSAPALPYICELRLCGLGMSDGLSPALATVLQQLSFLDLSHSRFRRLPAAISLITSLHELRFRCCPLLQLEGEDVGKLAALPHLKILDISKSDGTTAEDVTLTETSVRTLIALLKRLPHLRLPHFTE